ncbi:MAG: hypothetical protein O9267_12135, partial [Flavobacterium sp.]|uniref:hypothetical protein n=1 Tax=Flavobacterium sp. TaxID=239 RepID=UPI0022C348E9
MKKNYILLLILTVGFYAHSQVGINTTDPKTTLDVNGAITNRETSFAISGNAVDINAETSFANITGTATGIVSITALTPLINGYRLIIYNNTDGGFDATFYGTTIPNSQSVEFIYTDSSWKSTFGGTIAGGHNLFNTDGSLSGNRTVNQGTNNLTFSGTGNTNFNNGNVGIGTLTPSEKLDVAGKIKTTNFQMSSGAINGYVLASDATGTATWTKSFLPYTANGVNSATTATRDLNDWVVTKGTSIITTDVLANSTNKPDGLGAWFNTGIQSISNGYYSQFLLTDQEAFFRGNTVASINANQWRTIPNFLSFNKFQYNVASTTADSDLTLMKTGNYAMAFGTNNLERMRITNAGNVGIGTLTPATKLDVAAGTTTTNTVVNATGNINDFLQFNVQNTSTGTQAQSGYSATANNGSATTGFAWMGINNSAFNYPTAYNIGGGNDVSFVGSGQDLYLANANNTKSIIFSTG